VVARADAAKAGVTISTFRQSWEEFDFGKGRWELVVFSYAWVPLVDGSFVRKVRESLKPGDLIVIEHPVEEPGAAGPKKAVGAVNALVKAYADFRILRYEDQQDISDWQRGMAPRLKAKGRIVRLLAQKN
jgi:hypothetical protein